MTGPAGSEAFRLLTAVLKHLSPPGGELLAPGDLTRVGLDDVRDTPTLRMPYGQDVPVVQASAGMRRVISLAYLLVWAWQEHRRASGQLDQEPARNIVFLIDEIEGHLHPRWQRSIVGSLLEVVDALSPQTAVQLIAATHSPLVMASVEPRFDAKSDAWFDLDLEVKQGSAGVRLQRREFVRRGDASRWLTSVAFDLEEATSIEAEGAIRAALDLLARGDASPEEIERVDGRLRGALGDTDRFWTRWSQYRRSREEAA